VDDSIAATVWVPCVSKQSSGELAMSAILQMQYEGQARKCRYPCYSSTDKNNVYTKKHQIIHHIYIYIYTNHCTIIRYNNKLMYRNSATCFGIFYAVNREVFNNKILQ
jgi:hypothetical protein